MSRIVSYKGLLPDGTQEAIPLGTIRGETGYRIKKLEIMGAEPGTGTYELVAQIWSIQQSTIVGTVDFSDQTLIGVAYYRDNAGSQYQDSVTVVFDNITFNQDIYVTAKDVSGNVKPINWHLELEQVDLALDEATVATLKDIRNND